LKAIWEHLVFELSSRRYPCVKCYQRPVLSKSKDRTPNPNRLVRYF